MNNFNSIFLKLIFLSASFFIQGAIHAQPQSPVQIVVAFPPGGPTDRIARVIAPHLSAALGKAVVVENKPGASGMIAANYVARTTNPENVLFFSNAGALTINPALYSDLTYSTSKDFKPVSLVADTTTVMVTGTPTKFKDAADMVKHIKAGEKMTAGSSGVGGASHLSLEMFQEASGVNLLHVPYKGAAPVFADLVGKRVDVFFGDLPGLQGLIAGGKLKVLGVAADTRSPLLPDVPTLNEQGIKGVVPSGWYGLVMSSSAKDEDVQNLATIIKKIVMSPEVVKQLDDMGATPVTNTPAAFSEFLTKETQRWKELVVRRNISVAK